MSETMAVRVGDSLVEGPLCGSKFKGSLRDPKVFKPSYDIRDNILIDTYSSEISIEGIPICLLGYSSSYFSYT